MMNADGNQPLGMNWYRLLSIYSELGSSTNSHEKICDIGQELKKLDGKHDEAIQGINGKLDSLIQAGNVKLSSEDLSSLKAAVVEGLAKRAHESADQISAPVVSDGESLIFTPDVKEILASLVQQKAKVLSDVDLEKMAAQITSIDVRLKADAKVVEAEKVLLAANIKGIMSRLEKGCPMLKSDADTLNEWHEKIEKGLNKAAERDDPVNQAFATRRDALAEAVVAKMVGTDNTFGTALADAVAEKLGARGGWSSLSSDEMDVLATAIAAAQAESLTALATEQGTLKQTLEEGLRAINRKLVEEERRGGEGEVGGEGEETPVVPEGDDDDINAMAIDKVKKLFEEGDERLYIAFKMRAETALELSMKRRDRGAVSTEISHETLVNLVETRKEAQIVQTPEYIGTLTNDTFPYFEKTSNLFPIERLRVMHSFFVDLTFAESKSPTKGSNCATS